MAVFIDQKERNIIPRWRDFRTTISIGELNPSGTANESTLPAGDFLADKLQAWNENKTVSFATDLLGAAFVLGRQQEAEEAAKFILLPESGASSAARSLAKRIVVPESHEETIDEEVIPESEEQTHRQIHLLRRRLGDEPRNPILLVDLAREYTLLGLEKKAAHAMEVALKLSPTNRFVLRSAARMHIHQDEAEYAHRILRRAESTKYDPWLLAAELAVATSVGRSSQLVGAGRKILADASFAPSQTTELSSAIATLEFVNGKTQVARKLFRQSLTAPTENSVAQVEWASRHHLGFEVDVSRIYVPRVFEAQAWEFYASGDWKKSINQSWKWLYDQPFSNLPALFASFVASAVLEDYSEGERIIRFGLIANPQDPILLNNLAFIYASSGRIEEAEEEFAKINRSDISNTVHEVALLATEGLLNFRNGFQEQGRDLYLQAMEKAKGQIYQRSRTAAAINLAREEILSNSPEAQKAVARADNEAKNLSDTDIDIKLMLQRLLEFYRSSQPQQRLSSTGSLAK